MWDGRKQLPRNGFQGSVTAAALADTVLLSPNPHRDYVILSNTGPLDCLVSFGVPSKGVTGLYLASGDRPIKLTYAEIGDIIKLQAWVYPLYQTRKGAIYFDSHGDAALDTGTAGNSFDVHVPANGYSYLASGYVDNYFNGAPSVAMQVTQHGQIATLFNATANFYFQGPQFVDPGSVVHFTTVVGVAGSSVSVGATIAQSYPLSQPQQATVAFAVGEEYYH